MNYFDPLFSGILPFFISPAMTMFYVVILAGLFTGYVVDTWNRGKGYGPDWAGYQKALRLLLVIVAWLLVLNHWAFVLSTPDGMVWS